MVETNFTKIPNILLDNMEELGITNNRHLLVLIYLLRHKKGYRLSNKQIENSLSMHHKTVKDAINFLKENELLDYKETSQGKIYGFSKLLKKINDVKSAEDAKKADGYTAEEDAKSAEDDKNADAKSAEGGDKSAEGARPYRRPTSAIPPTNNTNYKINYKTNYKTTKFSFEKIRGRIVDSIQQFFDNDIDEVCKEIIDSVDPSFYKFRDYIPTEMEISTFLENNKEETLDNFNNYLYNGLVSESFLYNGKLIKPRLALLNNNKVRLNELLNIYYTNKEQPILNDNEESPYDKSPAFQEFLKQQQEKEPVKDKYSNLPEEEAAYLRALHSYDPPTEEELADVHVGEFKQKEYEEYEATSEEIDAILNEVDFDSSDDESLSEKEMDELIGEV